MPLFTLSKGARPRFSRRKPDVACFAAALFPRCVNWLAVAIERYNSLNRNFWSDILPRHASRETWNGQHEKHEMNGKHGVTAAVSILLCCPFFSRCLRNRDLNACGRGFDPGRNLMEALSENFHVLRLGCMPRNPDSTDSDLCSLHTRAPGAGQRHWRVRWADSSLPATAEQPDRRWC